AGSDPDPPLQPPHREDLRRVDQEAPPGGHGCCRGHALSDVARDRRQGSLNALLFLYRVVLEQDLPWLDEVVRARRPQRLPVVLTREEIRSVLERLDGAPRLMALLLYGAGLRLLECARLRVKDVDFATSQIVVRSGKGARDRVTMLPAAARPGLLRHLDSIRRQHENDVRCGAG